MRSTHFGTFVAGSLLLAAVSAHAGSIQLEPVADNTLYERDAGDLSNGSGDHLFFGQTGANAGNVLRRALLRFDLGAIPANSDVLSAELSITVNMVPPSATGFDAALHRVQVAWGEGASDAPGPEGSGAAAEPGDATWLHTFFDTDFWTAVGGDFAPAATATTALTAATGTFTFNGPGLVADVQSMLDNPAMNHGWVILGAEDEPGNARRIASRENPATDQRAVLAVEFEEGEPPAAVSVPTLGMPGRLLLGLLTMVLGVVALRRVMY